MVQGKGKGVVKEQRAELCKKEQPAGGVRVTAPLFAQMELLLLSRVDLRDDQRAAHAVQGQPRRGQRGGGEPVVCMCACVYVC